MSSHIGSILVVIAMEAEASPLINHLGLTQTNHSSDPQCPAHFFSGVYKDTKITVATNGKSGRYNVDNVGTVPSTLATYLGIMQFKPDIIVNAGTAGGFKAKGGAVGDVYLCSKVCNHDRRIAIPGFTDYGIGSYSGLSVDHIAHDLHYKTGVVSTGNSLDHTEMDDKMMLQNDASVKDMEAAAIAWVAEQYKVPFFCLKVVTDLVDGDRHSHEEFLENLHAASVSLQAALPKILEHLIGKAIADLI